MTAMMHKDILKSLPHMRGFARRLTRDRSMADDLVQTAVERALSNAHRFQPDTNFQAWITTILKNSYFNEIRARTRRPTVELDVERMASCTSGGQESRLEVRDFNRAYQHLTPEQQRALILIAVDGMTYEEAAEVETCAPGTMKSRVSRARRLLHQLLDGEAESLVPALPAQIGGPVNRAQMFGLAHRLASRVGGLAVQTT